MDITPTERHYLLEFIREEFEQIRKIREEQNSLMQQEQQRR